MNDYLGIESIFDISADGHGFSIPIVVGFLLLIFLVGLLSSRALRDKSLHVKHLFLKTNVAVNDVIKNGYIRTLDLYGESLVMNHRLSLGQVVKIDLGALPNFPATGLKLDALVKSVRVLGGQPSNFIVKLKYTEASSSSNSHLVTYLKKLLSLPL